MAKTGLFFALLGGVALVVARGTTLIAIGSLLAGVGLASIYPISVSLLASWFGKASRRVSGAVFGSGNVGGALMPRMVGTVSTVAGGLRFGFLVPLAGVVFMLGFYSLEQARLEWPKRQPFQKLYPFFSALVAGSDSQGIQIQ